MRRTLVLVATALLGAVACASYPAPSQRMADAVATTRAAQEVGANADPQAQVYLQQAQSEVAHAQQLVSDGDNKRAEFLLVRAKADAALALGLARQSAAEAEALDATRLVAAMRSGAASTTTTTGGTVPPPAPSGGPR